MVYNVYHASQRHPDVHTCQNFDSLSLRDFHQADHTMPFDEFILLHTGVSPSWVYQLQ
jgi:hypothetical protein